MRAGVKVFGRGLDGMDVVVGRTVVEVGGMVLVVLRVGDSSEWRGENFGVELLGFGLTDGC